MSRQPRNFQRLTAKDKEKIVTLHRKHAVGTTALAQRFGTTIQTIEIILRNAK